MSQNKPDQPNLNRFEEAFPLQSNTQQPQPTPQANPQRQASQQFGQVKSRGISKPTKFLLVTAVIASAGMMTFHMGKHFKHATETEAPAAISASVEVPQAQSAELAALEAKISENKALEAQVAQLKAQLAAQNSTPKTSTTKTEAPNTRQPQAQSTQTSQPTNSTGVENSTVGSAEKLITALQAEGMSNQALEQAVEQMKGDKNPNRTNQDTMSNADLWNAAMAQYTMEDMEGAQKIAMQIAQEYPGMKQLELFASGKIFQFVPADYRTPEMEKRMLGNSIEQLKNKQEALRQQLNERTKDLTIPNYDNVEFKMNNGLRTELVNKGAHPIFDSIALRNDEKHTLAGTKGKVPEVLVGVCELVQQGEIKANGQQSINLVAIKGNRVRTAVGFLHSHATYNLVKKNSNLKPNTVLNKVTALLNGKTISAQRIAIALDLAGVSADLNSQNTGIDKESIKELTQSWCDQQELKHPRANIEKIKNVGGATKDKAGAVKKKVGGFFGDIFSSINTPKVQEHVKNLMGKQGPDTDHSAMV